MRVEGLGSFCSGAVYGRLSVLGKHACLSVKAQKRVPKPQECVEY